MKICCVFYRFAHFVWYPFYSRHKGKPPLHHCTIPHHIKANHWSHRRKFDCDRRAALLHTFLWNFPAPASIHPTTRVRSRIRTLLGLKKGFHPTHFSTPRDAERIKKKATHIKSTPNGYFAAVTSSEKKWARSSSFTGFCYLRGHITVLAPLRWGNCTTGWVWWS